MVALQTSSTWPGSITVETVNQPTTGVLVQPDPMPQISNIRYMAAADVPVSQASFRATVDLSKVPLSQDESWARIQLVATDPRIQIIDYQPQQVRVELDPIIHRTVNVQVVTGAIPSGLSPATPVLSAQTVDVSGASTYVNRVSYAEAQVRVDASGLDVDEDVALVARDASDQVVSHVQFEPHSVRVQIQVGSQIRSETVAVHPNVTDSPAAGYFIASVTVTPSVVEVHGQADTLALLKGAATTEPVSVAGATSDVSIPVSLVLPTGVTSDTVTKIQVVVHLQAQTSTRSLKIGVVPQGARSDLNYSLSTLSVTVTLGGDTAALNALDTSTLVATVSVANLGPGTYTVTVTVVVPPGIKVVAISPGQITVTITVGSSPPPPTATP